MKITLCYSMQYAEKAQEAKEWLDAHGHEAFVSASNAQYVGLSDEDKEALKLEHKYGHDAIRKHYALIKDSDAILVLNYEKHSVPGYIGGNAFLEMGFAHVLHKKIYLLHPIPEMGYTIEIIAMQPILLEGELENL